MITYNQAASIYDLSATIKEGLKEPIKVLTGDEDKDVVIVPAKKFVDFVPEVIKDLTSII